MERYGAAAGLAKNLSNKAKVSLSSSVGSLLMVPGAFLYCTSASAIGQNSVTTLRRNHRSQSAHWLSCGSKPPTLSINERRTIADELLPDTTFPVTRSASA